MSWLWRPSRGRGQSPCFTHLRRSRHTPRPRRGRGAGGRGAHRQPPPSGPKGRGGAGRGGGGPPRRTETGPARQGPGGAKPPRPAGPRRFGAPRTQQNNPVLFSSGGRNARTINKTCVLLGSPGGCRRRTLAAEHRGQLRGAVSRKKGGYYDTPPRERLVTTLVLWA